MIKVDNLRYAYQGSRHKVFDDFSLQLEGNGIYGLLGKNGTGKSTLLYLISGLLRPGQGTVEIDGQRCFDRKPEMMADLFLVPEEFDLPDCTLDEYVRVNSVFYPRFSRELLDECLKDFEVEPHANLHSLSMGQKKKVFMSYALATNTRLLLMDEPTNGLDIPSKSLFRKVVAKHMTDDRTLIISTHQVHDIENLLDHIVIIDNSRVLLDAPVADITGRYAFRTIPTSEAATAVYCEPSMGGLDAIVYRQEGEPETQVNLELLFDAAVKGKITAPPLTPPPPRGGDDMADRQFTSHPSDTSTPPLGGGGDRGGAVWHLLRWLLSNKKKQYLISTAGGMCAVALPYIMWLTFGIEDAPQELAEIFATIFSLVFIVYFLTCGAFIVSNIHDKRTRIPMFLLPASKTVGFVARYVEVLILRPLTLLIGIVGGDLIQMALYGIVRGEAYSVTAAISHVVYNYFGDVVIEEFAALLLFHTFFLLSGMVFRRYAWIKTWLVIMVISFFTTMVTFVSMGLIFQYALGPNQYHVEFYDLPVLYTTLYYVITLGLAALCYWGAYRIYSRMQVIGNKWHNL